MSPMPPSIALLFALAVPGVDRPEQPPPAVMGEQLAQLTFHQRIVIRVPRLPDPRDTPPPLSTSDSSRVREKKGPKCVAIPLIEGASVTHSDSVDLVTTDGDILRAHLDNRCPAIDFYQGFYLRRTADGQLCAGRDALRARSGGECRIKSFKQLMRKR